MRHLFSDKFSHRGNFSLLAIGTISTLLLVWLSVSFWYEAYMLRSDALRLQQAVNFENAVFNVSKSIAQDQGRLFKAGSESGVGLFSDLTNDKTSSLINTLIDESYALHQYPGSGTAAPGVLALLQAKIHALSNEHQKILAFIAELNTASGSDTNSELNSSIETSPSINLDERTILFRAYANLNQDLSNILQSAKQSYTSKRRNSEIASAKTLQSLVWDLRESTIEMELQMDRDIFVSSLGVGIQDSPLAIHNITTRLDRIDNDITSLSNLGSTLVDDHSLNSKIRSLASWHQANYKPTLIRYIDSKSNKIHVGLQAIDASNDSLILWSETCKERTDHYENLWSETNQLVNALTTTLINKANRNLIIDSLLILLATLMGIWIVKTVRQMKYQAEHDSLTNLPNRRKLHATLTNEIENSFIPHNDNKQHGKPDKDQTNKQKVSSDHDESANSVTYLAVIRIDLNKFKLIKETLGNTTGDSLLKTVARRLHTFNSADVMPASMGGSEFIAVVKCKTKEDGISLARTMKERLQEDINLSGKRFNVDARLGIAFYPDHASNADELLQAADFAKLQACEPNATCVGVYDKALAESIQYRLDIESELVAAINENQLALHYQPQFDVNKNIADRLEALVRWQHPSRGFMPPGDFLSIAENSGLMPMLGDWVLREAIRQTAAWNAELSQSVAVAVNVSADQLAEESFVPSVIAYLNQYQLNPELLEIEITESLYLHDVDLVSKTLDELRKHNIRIALDDFGTGYSSLSQLHALPVDTLKIDRSFVQLLDDPQQSSLAVTSTIISMAKHYKLEIVAEGAETAEHVKLLSELQVDLIQGYYFSKPVAAEHVPATLLSVNNNLSNIKAA